MVTSPMASASAISGEIGANSVLPAHRHGRPLTEDSPWAKQNVLTFDGGGVRGYYSLLQLQYLMEFIQQAEDDLNADGGLNYTENLSSFSPCQEPRGFSYCTKKESRFLPCHYFDYISGTSTGALITIMLTTLRMSVNDCLLEYKKLAGLVFGHPRPLNHPGVLGVVPFLTRNKYATTNLEDAIKDVIRRRGEATHDYDDALLFRTPKGLCRAIVFANRSIQSGLFNHPWPLRSYDNFSTQAERTTEIPLDQGRGTNLAAWKVARAATAAYLYFKPLELTSHDGEVVRHRKRTTNLSLTSRRDSNGQLPITEEREQPGLQGNIVLLTDAGFSKINNPSVSVMYELRRVFRRGPKRVTNFVSIGTARQISRYNTSTLLGLVRTATIEIGNSEDEHKRMEEMYSHEINYYRLNESDGLADVDMDDWKPRKSGQSGSDTIKKMEDAFRRWAREPGNQNNVRNAARRLVEIRRARTKEYSRWERFALGRRFTCPADDCFLDSDETWHYRDSFIHHLQADHGYDDDSIERAIRSFHRDWQYKSRVQ